MMAIDSHQHFWKFNQERDSWMTPGIMENIRRDFLPDDLKPILDQLGIEGTIAVQADQSREETDFLLELASDYPWIKGVVGWVDFRSPDIREQLQEYRSDHKLVGFRHILQSEAVSLMADTDFLYGIDQLAGLNFTYDLLIYWHQLEAAIDFVAQFPDLPIVLDHVGKPDIKDGRILKWSKGMAQLAEMPNVYCKVSGMVTEAHWLYWQEEDFLPYFDQTFELFGVDRCMFGSDWPVCTLASTYEQWFSTVQTYMARFSDSEQKAFFNTNCHRFYGFDS
ncbi:MAG: amidohydrolase family protein [Saprospiraceae bacterium]|nr:amidohydrolase family protein [Saprospiraceae bacterium]